MKTIGHLLRWCAKQLGKIPNPGPGGELFVIIFGVPLFLLGMIVWHYPIWTAICVGSVYFAYRCWKASEDDHDC
jgi:hypothetical protein